MSDRRSSADLGARAEATLGAFPFPDRDWESDARAVEARLGDSMRGSTDALLLAAPLPSEPGEPSTSSATATPLANSGVRTQSLAEIARRSVDKKHSEEREMARQSLAIAAQVRPSDVRRPALEASAVPAPPQAPPVSAVNVARPSAPPAQPSSPAWQKLALGIPLLALAAAVALWFERPEPAPLVTNDFAKKSVATPAAAATTNAPASVPRGVDPNSLPGETHEVAKEGQAASKGLAMAASKAVAPNSAPAKPTTEPVVLDDDQPGPAPSLAVASPAPPAPEKALPPDPALRPADSTGAELVAKPTTGAVQAALGSVMSGARHCVAGDDAPSSAVVVFGSDGRVQRVSVSGPAAGKASGACIEAQLGKARVQPFAAASFSVNATVRPE